MVTVHSCGAQTGSRVCVYRVTLHIMHVLMCCKQSEPTSLKVVSSILMYTFAGYS